MSDPFGISYGDVYQLLTELVIAARSNREMALERTTFEVPHHDWAVIEATARLTALNDAVEHVKRFQASKQAEYEEHMAGRMQGNSIDDNDPY